MVYEAKDVRRQVAWREAQSITCNAKSIKT